MWRLKGCPKCCGDLVLCTDYWCCIYCEFEHPEYLKGQQCPYREGLLCQEGYCSSCYIFLGGESNVSVP